MDNQTKEKGFETASIALSFQHSALAQTWFGGLISDNMKHAPLAQTGFFAIDIVQLLSHQGGQGGLSASLLPDCLLFQGNAQDLVHVTYRQEGKLALDV